MKIFMTCPGFARHGGIRVILEWANRLSERHEVYLRVDGRKECSWFDISSAVKVIHDDSYIWRSDCLIITSPHGVHYLDHPAQPKRIFVFMQMAEHLFNIHDKYWQDKCQKFYLTKHPLISISEWNVKLLRRAGRTGAVHLVGNGVNLDHFPISTRPKDGKYILVEGWEASNPTKDWDKIGPRVCQRLQKEGYRIMTYSPKPLVGEFKGIPDTRVVNPTLHHLNYLYEKATILIKASKYDARSCSPMEAMTKGTVTARAIWEGDDDLINGHNCSRSHYNEEELYQNAKRLLEDHVYREQLADNCRAYVQYYSWDKWMGSIESILGIGI